MSEKEKKETTETTKKTKRTPKKEEVKKAYCYIGPNIPNGALKQNAVLRATREEIKDKFKEEIELFPQIERLIVPVEKLADTKRKVKETGNTINKHYRDLIETIKEENKKEV